MRNERDQSTIDFARWATQNQTGPNLRGKPQVNEPDFASLRLLQSEPSRRSSSRKTWSAARTRSSSFSTG